MRQTRCKGNLDRKLRVEQRGAAKEGSAAERGSLWVAQERQQRLTVRRCWKHEESGSYPLWGERTASKLPRKCSFSAACFVVHTQQQCIVIYLWFLPVRKPPCVKLSCGFRSPLAKATLCAAEGILATLHIQHQTAPKREYQESVEKTWEKAGGFRTNATFWVVLH